MLDQSQRESFARDGFLLLPGAVDRAVTEGLRHILAGIFSRRASYEGDFDDRGRIGSVRFDVCARYPEVRFVLALPGITQPLQSLLGDDFVYLPEMAAHQDGYGSWHKDTTSQERAGLRFHWAPDFLMLEACLYLQENSEELGGGLEVIPGSHRMPDTYKDAVDRTIFQRVRTKLRDRGLLPVRRGFRIPSRPGDLLLFDFRLDHKASWPRRRVPTDRRKLALFVAASRNNGYAGEYVRYVRNRPDYAYLKVEGPEAQDLRSWVEAHRLRLIR